MSCTVLAIPYALAWIISATGVGVGAVKAIEKIDDLIINNLDSSRVSNNIQAPCEDVTVITDRHFIEKSFETAFMDKDILIKTLEEHGVRSISEDEFGKICGAVDNYTLTFEKLEADKPYFLKISCLETDNAEEKLNDLNSEYALNVQEEAYLNIIDKLKENNMQIENEEVTDDNTIVLTVNID